MQSEFETACAQAREDIAVPEFSLAAIRARHERTAPGKRGRRGVFAAIALGLSMAAIAAAAVVTASHVEVTKSGGLVISGTITNQRATPGILASALHQADFNVIVPEGLPTGTTMRSVLTAGKDVIALEYDLPGSWRKNDHILYVILANRSAVQGRLQPAKEPLKLRAPHPRVESWRIGVEQVFISSDHLTPAELARIKSAMQKEAAR